MLNNQLLLQGATGYNISRSLRFRRSASAYLNRTPASAGNRKTFTISMWVKRGNSGSNISLVSCRSSSSPLFQYQFYSDNTLSVEGSGSQLRTTQLFRDFSAWYHLVIAFDTTQATASNRIKMYVNGAEVTSFQTATYPTQNTDMNFNVASATSIGSLQPFDTQYFDGYMAEIISVDGQALTPSSFGATNAQTGVWQPKKYAGTYGTNGFYLPFTDNSALTSGSNAGLGKDFSGNGNYWNTNNISITSGATYDSMTDVPTLTSATASNFCVLNPLNLQSSMSISEGNLSTQNTATVARTTIGTMGMPSGKWYAEMTAIGTGLKYVGICTTQPAAGDYLGFTTGSYAYNSSAQKVSNGGTTASYGASWTAGDVIGIAFDNTTGALEFYKNGTSQGVAFTGIASDIYFYGFSSNSASGNGVYANFGQRPFAYTPPTGYVALNTYNLPTPTIGATASTQANKYMDATLYSGNGSSQSIVNAGGFQPDLVWVKGRNYAWSHYLYDVIRTAGKALYSNLTNAEATDGGMTSFNSNGFSVGSGALNDNTVPSTYVAWQWKANGSGSSNTAGSITSTVSANTSAGFSVVTYTGTGSAATVGHGLGVAPKMVIVKRRNSTGSWAVYHAGLPSANYELFLERTEAAGTPSASWNNTAPTSSVFSIGTGTAVNTNTGTYVAYCFAEVAGYSKFGSYTGNGSTDGTFVYTGFRPRFIMIKNYGAVQGWCIVDTARGTYNLVDNYLQPNSSAAESSGYAKMDILSNGFKLRDTDQFVNGTSAVYIYAAFAENPYKYSLAR